MIQGTNEHSKRKEVSSFIRNFIANYYSFSPANHAEQMGRAGDLMEKGLWDQKRESLLKINERLKVEPLIQKAEILSIDLLASDHADPKVKPDPKDKSFKHACFYEKAIGKNGLSGEVEFQDDSSGRPKVRRIRYTY